MTVYLGSAIPGASYVLTGDDVAGTIQLTTGPTFNVTANNEVLIALVSDTFNQFNFNAASAHFIPVDANAKSLYLVQDSFGVQSVVSPPPGITLPRSLFYTLLLSLNPGLGNLAASTTYTWAYKVSGTV